MSIKSINQKALKFFKNNIKETKEHNMIVDMERSDLSKICKPGTVKIFKKKFVEEYSVPYLHLSDTKKDTCKKYPGTNIAGLAKRATFIIDKNGIIKNIFRDIDVKNHGRQIVESLKKL